ncbi:MAG: ribonuclease HI [Christensenellales bacterium]
MKKVDIYTDGACSGNPGAGAYAAILIYKGVERVVKGYEAETTNNRMELKAVIEALKALKERCEVNIYTDSAYITNAYINGWINNWVLSGWRTLSNSDVQNTDLWEELFELTNMHSVNFIKVKGHSDNEYNNRCDMLARGEITRAKNS